MLVAPYRGTHRQEILGPTGCGTTTSDADSRGTILTANATPGSDGAYTQLVAATAFNYESIQVTLTRPHPAAAAQQLIDIAIGAAAAERIIVADLPIVNLSSRPTSYSLWLPIHIPKGARVAARIHRSTVASSTCDIAIVGVDHSPYGVPPYRRCTTYGTVLASAKGTQVDPGAVANTKSAAVQIVAATTWPMHMVAPIVLRSQTGGSTTTDDAALVEFYVGGAGSEKSLIPYCALHMSATGDIYIPNTFGPFKVNQPAGVRLSVKAQSTSILASARELAVTLLGFD